jgi:very-short-patch-repair endonuclease
VVHLWRRRAISSSFRPPAFQGCALHATKRDSLTPSPLPKGEGQLARRWVEQVAMPRFLRGSTFRARSLRQASTDAERALWQMLRGRKLNGAKFRRQQPLGPYFADFFCEQAMLVVELDGQVHHRRSDHDRKRDAFLRRAGLTVLRFENRAVFEHPDRVLSCIRAYLMAPLPRERGWGEGKSFPYSTMLTHGEPG